VTEKNTLVAVYGTLRRGYGNHSLLGDSPLVGVGRTVKEFLMLASGFPVCLENDDSGTPTTQVTVEVYDVGLSSNPEQIMRRLDNLEGHPDWYERKETECLVTPEGWNAQIHTRPWMYIMPGTRDDFRSWTHVPSGDYSEFRERRTA
jgi:gamma-glutamylcyclotransferase (GGCT)/AIG2-like uncharacterized protein YtfP